MLRKPRAKPAHERAGKIRCALSIGGADAAQHSGGKRTEHSVGAGLELSHGATGAQGYHGALVSVADLTFLPALPRVICRNVKSKATLESYSCWCPFVF